MYSIRKRLLISSIGLVVLFLGVLAFFLNDAFNKNISSNAYDSLRNQILLLISDIDVVGEKIIVPERVSDPRLSQADGTLFAQISDGSGDIIWSSSTLLDSQLVVVDSVLGEFNFVDQTRSRPQNPIYQMSLGVEWETDQGDIPMSIQVAESAGSYLNRLARVQRQIAFGLGLLGAGLVSLLWLTLAWGLNPLQRVSRQVVEIEQGKRDRFDQDYPLEVSMLTRNLNQLLNHDESRIEQQKQTLGNLAHSLKTPLAVLRGLSFDDKDQAIALEQLSSMQNIIEYQLQSASAVGRRRFAKAVDIYQATMQTTESLKKLHQAKNVDLISSIDDGVAFYGDVGDYLEVIGNLLDNAYKWSNQKVEFEVKNIPPNNASPTRKGLGDATSARQWLHIQINDDGPGIEEEVRERILERGVRLDSQQPGHGIGLDIVKGLVVAYDGDMRIDKSHLGGSRFNVILR